MPTLLLVLFFKNNFSLLRKRHAFIISANSEDVVDKRLDRLPFAYIKDVLDEKMTLEQAELAEQRRFQIEEDITAGLIFSRLNSPTQRRLLTGPAEEFQQFLKAPGDFVDPKLMDEINIIVAEAQRRDAAIP